MGSQISSRGGTFHNIEFRRNDRDRAIPRRVLTPVLMGDPRPDREARSEELRKSLARPAKGDGNIARHDGKYKRSSESRQ